MRKRRRKVSEAQKDKARATWLANPENFRKASAAMKAMHAEMSAEERQRRLALLHEKAPATKTKADYKSRVSRKSKSNWEDPAYRAKTLAAQEAGRKRKAGIS